MLTQGLEAGVGIHPQKVDINHNIIEYHLYLIIELLFHEESSGHSYALSYL